MTINGNLPKQSSQTDWRLIGQSELSIHSNSDKLPQGWLFQILEPFNLPADLTAKIKTSLEEALGLSSACSNLSLIEVKIYLSKDVEGSDSSNRNWGFFKLEKARPHPEMEGTARPVTEYYLYLEP